MNDKLDQTLCEKYPEIFVNRTASPMETAMCWGFECGDGWYDLLDRTCRHIQHHIKWVNREELTVAPVVAVQIKEKFGGLRFYYEGGDEYVRGVVDMAESLSHTICEVCGEKGKPRQGGWIRTLCDHHDEENKKNKAAA